MPDIRWMQERWKELQERNHIFLHCADCDDITAHADVKDDPIFIHAYVCLSCGTAWEAELDPKEIN